MSSQQGRIVQENTKLSTEQTQSSDHSDSSSHPNSAFQWSTFIAGGAAGAASRTVVSPLERLKKPAKGQKRAYSGVGEGLARIWREEGFKGYMRGNGINCLRIAPYSAVQFTTYEAVKDWLCHPWAMEHLVGIEHTSHGDQVKHAGMVQLLAGASAGMTSVVTTYPLDLVRSRISIASASVHKIQQSSHSNASVHVPGVVEMTTKVYREEGGMRGLYRGCIPTSMVCNPTNRQGVAPYVAFNFFFYEHARQFFSQSDGTPPGALMKLACGAWAGAISQTLTYPLDVIRRRMQVAGMQNSSLGYHDKSKSSASDADGIDAIRNIIQRSGIKGLYFGLIPNLLKVAPSMGTSFLTYEVVRGLLDQHDD
ncbi:hypothetical protein MPSI1_001092 [Malassezia psittaci]|uniref:Mitochondrial carrier protein n=1 Tax=Malassezia psittaci TaxID=1821823 RepID=A0AAF0JCZ4_9BASI|nr:hypothetical protein MPSI1_001092 [Malassezia psittaci]